MPQCHVIAVEGQLAVDPYLVVWHGIVLVADVNKHQWKITVARDSSKSHVFLKELKLLR